MNNADNLVRVTALLAALRKHRLVPSAEPFVEDRSLPRPTMDSTVPQRRIRPFEGLRMLDGSGKQAVQVLSAAGPAACSGVEPSLWPHLAVQVRLLEEIAPELAAILSSSQFRTAYDQLSSFAEVQARQALAARRGPIDPPPFVVADATEALERFSRRITEMTLIGRVLLLRAKAGA